MVDTAGSAALWRADGGDGGDGVGGLFTLTPGLVLAAVIAVLVVVLIALVAAWLVWRRVRRSGRLERGVSQLRAVALPPGPRRDAGAVARSPGPDPAGDRGRGPRPPTGRRKGCWSSCARP